MERAGQIPLHPFTSAMARTAGVSRHRMDDLVGQRQVRRVLRNVYVRADLPDSVELRAAAARLVVSDVTVVTGRSAAWLWGVDTFEYRELEILPPLETCALRGHTRARRPELASGVRDLAPRDVTRLHGVLVTTPMRTALDLVCSLSRRRGIAALEGFMRIHGLSRGALQGELVRFRRRRGVVQARELVAIADERTESPGESWTRLEIIDRGLPVPEAQHWVCDRGRQVFRLDLSYPKHRIAVEFDGREFHDDKVRRDHDHKRRRWLASRGWTVIVVTKDDFSTDRIDTWIEELRTALGEAG